MNAPALNTVGCNGATIILRSGGYFDFADPDPATIHVEDVAWGLARQCRFNGQLAPAHDGAIYSVAQHCAMMIDLVDEPFKLEALLHDGAEAFTGDMVKPLKNLLPDFRDMELQVEMAFATRFRLPAAMSPEVKRADIRMLRTEQRDISPGAGHAWNGLEAYETAPFSITPWSVRTSAERWLNLFYILAPRELW